MQRGVLVQQPKLARAGHVKDRIKAVLCYRQGHRYSTQKVSKKASLL